MAKPRCQAAAEAAQATEAQQQARTKFSKAMSKVLRHKPPASVDGSGWVPIADILERLRQPHALHTLLAVVAEDAKGRFEVRCPQLARESGRGICVRCTPCAWCRALCESVLLSCLVSPTVRVCVAVLLELTELAKPAEMPCLCCNTHCWQQLLRTRSFCVASAAAW